MKIILIEKKIHYSERKIYPEKAVLIGKTRKSIKNYVDYIRPRFESQYSKDYLFITPKEGRPYSPTYLGHKMNETGKLVYPDFNEYLGRHWFATARLIKCWIEKHPDPLTYTQKVMGHDEQKTTEGYVFQAQEMFRLYPYDWFKRTLKFDIVKEESALKSKQRLKTPVSTGNSPRSEYGPAEI